MHPLTWTVVIVGLVALVAPDAALALVNFRDYLSSLRDRQSESATATASGDTPVTFTTSLQANGGWMIRAEHHPSTTLGYRGFTTVIVANASADASEGSV